MLSQLGFAKPGAPGIRRKHLTEGVSGCGVGGSSDPRFKGVLRGVSVCADTPIHRADVSLCEPGGVSHDNRPMSGNSAATLLECGGQPAMRVASAQIAAMEPRRIMMMLRISGGRSGTMPSASGGGGRNRANVVPTASAPPMASSNHGRRFSPRNTLLRLLAVLMVARRKLVRNVQHAAATTVKT